LPLILEQAEPAAIPVFRWEDEPEEESEVEELGPVPELVPPAPEARVEEDATLVFGPSEVESRRLGETEQVFAIAEDPSHEGIVRVVTQANNRSAGVMDEEPPLGPPGAAALAASPPGVQKQMLGGRLFPAIQKMHPGQAGRITGKLLELPNK